VGEDIWPWGTWDPLPSTGPSNETSVTKQPFHFGFSGSCTSEEKHAGVNVLRPKLPIPAAPEPAASADVHWPVCTTQALFLLALHSTLRR
jgi:hypothetical protein